MEAPKPKPKKVARKPKPIPEIKKDPELPAAVAVAKADPVEEDDEDGEDDETNDSDETKPTPATVKDSKKLIDEGQQAFLAAELRSSIDSLTAAEKVQPLDYDNLNWLGLAHYFLNQNDDAAARWNQALAMDTNRPDAVNNLGGIAKRKGDLDGEIAAYEKALSLHPNDCHALNNMSLVRAKQGKFTEAYKVLAESDTACGGNYAYTFIQRAGILALQGKKAEAMNALEQGLAKVDTLLPIKEYEVEADLLLDPAFASLRTDARFTTLTTKFLPRAVQSKDQIVHASASTPKASDLKDPFADL